jgi:pimeloyl-ACP methyl ester carboxylesterase
VAAESLVIKAVISQMGFADGEAVITNKMTHEDKNNFIAALQRMVEKKRLTGKEMFVSISKVLSDEESKHFIQTYRERFPEMDIKIPFLTVAEILAYKPQEAAAQVRCPVLIVVAGSDSVNPPEQGVALFDALQTPNKQLHIEAGARHYDMYEGPHFAQMISLQTEWFDCYL